VERLKQIEVQRALQASAPRARRSDDQDDAPR
jgi:hypothetical protein